MIESYSNNVSVAVASPIPFNSVSVVKGCTVEQQSPATFLFNKRGIYHVAVDASVATSATAGDIVFQLLKDGVAQPQAISRANSATATDIEAMGFETLVQVEDDNTCCCSKIPTTIQIQNVGVAALYNHVNIVITRIC